MIYKRKNGKRSFFKNSYQEVATLSFFGAISMQLALKGIDLLTINNDNFGYIFILQAVVYCLFYVMKFKKYFTLVD